MKNLKNKFILASAILALASCADNSYLGDQEEKTSAGGAISFGFDVPTPTRGTSEDAGKLSNQFIVYGEKNENGGSAPSTGNLVFQNYKVAYAASTANTTTSNTNNWEYVGLSWTAAEQGNITTSTTDAQTIKFWDDAATSYTFTAVSAKPDDISSGRIKITKNTSGTDQYAKGYTITLAKTTGTETVYPDLTHLYFADRNNIAKGNGYNHSVVTMNFRNTLSKVRVGIYETIPGYRISAITFYKQDGTTPYTDGASTPTEAFGAVCPNHNPSKFEGTLTVTYADNNSGHADQPIVSLSGATAATDLVLGTNFNSLTVGSTDPSVAAKFLGEDATNATYDTDGGTYTAVMPQTAGSNLKLKVNYTLYNTITKETINITGKTAEVPAEYLNWKANYKYTYLFKITDDDLNPITFDAAVIEDAVGNAEYITTVSEPSITTFGVTSTGVYSTGKDEYEVGTDIYATIMSGNTVVTPVLSGVGENTKIYRVTSTNETTYPITEASVAESIAHPTNNQITATDISNDATTNFTDVPKAVTSVPAEDGITTKTINAVKLTGVKTTGYYAIEYTYTVSNETKKAYKVIKVVAAP